MSSEFNITESSRERKRPDSKATDGSDFATVSLSAVLPTASNTSKHLGVNFMCVPQMKEISAICAMQLKVRY